MVEKVQFLFLQLLDFLMIFVNYLGGLNFNCNNYNTYLFIIETSDYKYFFTFITYIFYKTFFINEIVNFFIKLPANIKILDSEFWI